MWDKIKNWFWRSETIAWGRLQIIVGAIWTALSVTDLSPVLNPKLMTYWLIFSGVVTELLRRRGATEQTVVVPQVAKDGSLQPVQMSYLQTPPPGP
jgi:hypothetical protein